MSSRDPRDGTADFLPKSWEEKGYLESIPARSDKAGRLVPHVRVVDPGWGDRKGSGYMYLLVHGIIEDVADNEQEQAKTRGRTVAAFPLGVGKSESRPDELLAAILKLKITVRRTAGSGERIVFGVNSSITGLEPWKNVLLNGAIFSAHKVCNNVDEVRLDVPQRLRPIFLTITLLTDDGVYQIPKFFSEFRATNAVSFNLLVQLIIGADLSLAGVRGVIDEDGEKITTFMVHIGNFMRRNGKVYSVQYCRGKVDRMDLHFSLGAIGGLSFHVRVLGKISKALHAQLGFKRSICYSLMDTNPTLNRLVWRADCRIKKVTAVFQPSLSSDFKIYDDILIDNTGKILKR
nr:matrix protein [Bovine narmovirus 1]WFG82185.1 matrix protein [Bovine narmovirus 1]